MPTIIRKSLFAYLFAMTILAPTLGHAANAASNMANKVEQDVKKTAQNISQNISDATITTKIKAAYALESDIPSLKISVSTEDGVVILGGTVDTSIQAQRLIELARDVDGVKAVNDSALKVTKSKNYFEDAMITARAKLKIFSLYNNDQITDGYDLQVETTNGDVHIFGTVKNNADKSTIKKAISEVADVKEVSLNIKTEK